MVGIHIPYRTIEELGYRRVLEHLAGCAQSEPGARACRILPFHDERVKIEQELTAVSEMKRLLIDDDAPSFSGLVELGPALSHLRKGGVLHEEDLVAMGRCLDTVARARRLLMKKTDTAPGLVARAREVDPFDSLAGLLTESFDDAGRLRDDASPQLHEARGRERGCRDQIRRTLDEYLTDPNLQPMLQGDYFTLRESRYVLPVRTSMQGRVPGIIHGTSNSEESVYIEPELVVKQNNQLMLAREQVREAELAVMAELSSDLRDVADGIEAALPVMVHLETALARARLSQEWGTHQPQLTDAPTFALYRCRNPLLLLQDEPVVANDFILDGERRFIVISGPNAGGKTVSLDTIGLSFLFLAAGMHVPASPDSVMFVPSAVHTLMGESQDIEQSLSTFSGQLVRFDRVLRSMGERDLLLADEVMAGTDPNEGAALAWACLERIADRGIVGVVTTHYELLKTLPYHDPRFVNANMGLDPGSGRPNYRLTLGTPGSSAPLRIASDLGFDQGIIQRASEILGSRDEKIDEIIRRMEDETARIRAERTRMEMERRSLETRQEVLTERLTRVDTDARRMALERSEALMTRIKNHEGDLKRLLRRLQTDRTPEGLKRVRGEVGQVRDAVHQEIERQRRELSGGPSYETAPVDAIRPGVHLVHVPTGKKAEVVTVDKRRETAFLRVGAVGLKARFADLALGEPAAKKMKRSVGQDDRGTPTARIIVKGRQAVVSTPVGDGASDSLQDLIRTEDNTLNLIGMTVDDAMARLEKRLDQDTLADREALFVVHGVGTGKLRKAIRWYLDRSEYVSGWLPAEESHGGDAVTVIRLQ